MSQELHKTHACIRCHYIFEEILFFFKFLKALFFKNGVIFNSLLSSQINLSKDKSKQYGNRLVLIYYPIYVVLILNNIC